jgi:hypothetical protein
MHSSLLSETVEALVEASNASSESGLRHSKALLSDGSLQSATALHNMGHSRQGPPGIRQLPGISYLKCAHAALRAGEHSTT